MIISGLKLHAAFWTILATCGTPVRQIAVFLNETSCANDTVLHSSQDHFSHCSVFHDTEYPVAMGMRDIANDNRPRKDDISGETNFWKVAIQCNSDVRRCQSQYMQGRINRNYDQNALKKLI
jgi:hypothetical protein